MSFSLGIIGLPNVGKSTLFKALTRKQALIANYPFATIDPNIGVVEVPDERLAKLAEISHPEKIIPTTIEFVDIAGLVKGASQGEGLGNKFLSHIREVAAIIQVVRDFSDSEIIHVSGAVNPRQDFEIVNTELALADLEQVSRRLSSLRSEVKAGINKNLEKEIALFEKIKEGLEKEKAIRDLSLTEEELAMIKPFSFLTAKPMLAVLNVDEGVTNHPLPPPHAPEHSSVRDFASQGGDNFCLPLTKGENQRGFIPAIPISAKIEAELADLPLAEARAYLESLGQKQSGLDRLILASYKLLDLITFLTTGPKETRAWTIRAGTKAPQAAGVIHSDFEKGFIRVEVCDWRDFIKYGGEAGVKEKGLWRLEGKEYVMRDGDVVYFRVSG